jgi:nicotinate dehydrogenase subunit B
MSDEWSYGQIEDYAQRAHGAGQIGDSSSPYTMGIRGHSMRTPGQFQQNFPRELAITEAAIMAGQDMLQFRIDHANDQRTIAVLEAVREASEWQSRPSARGQASHETTGELRGRGVSMMYRQGTYWACVCKIAVIPATGQLTVEKVTLALDPGIVINPQQLIRNAEGGVTMGLSQALIEEVTFDQSMVTDEDWMSYPILTMAELPEINVVLVPMEDASVYGGGAEAANVLPSSAIAGAIADATGHIVRQLPLTQERLQAAFQVSTPDSQLPVSN